MPGIYQSNWNGYETNLDIKDFLVDVENYDFSPIAGSPLIDNGSIYNNLNISYNGINPDIGAYEYGGEYWTPGITWDVNLEFGEYFYPPNDLSILLGDVNYDQIINVVDIIFIVNSIIDDTEYNVIADLNEDGIINVVDIVAIVNIILNY